MDDPRTDLMTRWIKDFRKGLLIFVGVVVVIGISAFLIASLSAR